MNAATTAMNSGVAPLSMPVTDDDTRSSANGKIDNGMAIQITPSSTMRGMSTRSIRTRRAAGNRPSVSAPNPTRMGVMSAAGNACRPSAMK